MNWLRTLADHSRENCCQTWHFPGFEGHIIHILQSWEFCARWFPCMLMVEAERCKRLNLSAIVMLWKWEMSSKHCDSQWNISQKWGIDQWNIIANLYLHKQAKALAGKLTITYNSGRLSGSGWKDRYGDFCDSFEDGSPLAEVCSGWWWWRCGYINRGISKKSTLQRLVHRL